MNSDPHLVSTYRAELAQNIRLLQKYLNDFKKLEEDLYRLDLPQLTWEESMDSPLLYNLQYHIGLEMEKINRAFSLFYHTRANVKQGVRDNAQLNFSDRVILESKCRELVELIEMHEKALRLHKETLERKLKLSQSASYLLTREAQRNFSG